MTERKGVTYRGVRIRPCECEVGVSGFRWYAQSHHVPTGIMYEERLCGHCRTLAEAREGVGRVAEEG